MKLLSILGAVVAVQAVPSSDPQKHCTRADYPETLKGLNLLKASAKDVSETLAAGTVTSVELIDAYLARIEAHNRKGLNLRAIIETAPYDNVRAIAQRLDDERADGKVRSALHGVPIVVKDNYDTHPELGMNTTSGSYVMLKDGGQTIEDAFVVKKLRDAGVIVLGKANLMEWCGISGVNASAWSPRGGQCSSSYVAGGFDAGGDPAGSSSGSGVSVASGFVPMALGSDTEGSIVNPCSRGALYCMRPSIGRTSRTGVIPISTSQDTTGPMGKSAWDVAAALELMAGYDESDPYTKAANVYRPDNYTQFLDAEGFRGLRIGVVRDPFFSNETERDRMTTKAFDEAIKKITALGATVLELRLPNADEWNYTFTGSPVRSNDGIIMTQFDFKTDIADYLQQRRVNSTVNTLEDIINSRVKHWGLETGKEHKCCFPTFVAADQTTARNVSGEYWHAKQTQERLYEEGPAAVFQEYQLDLFALPTEFMAARFGATGSLPVGTVPLGSDNIGLPFGLSFVGKRYEEGSVIRALSAYEAHFPARKLPPTLV